MNSQEQAQQLLDHLKQMEELAEQKKALQSVIQGEAISLNELMEEESCDKVSIEGIEFKPTIERDFTLAERYKGRPWDSVPEFFKFLRDTDNEALIKTKETVAWNTRKAFFKDWVDDGNALPQFIKETFFETVKWNKTAVKKLVGGDGR